MIKNILAAMAISTLLAGSALAQTTPSKSGSENAFEFEMGDRSLFMNDNQQMRTEAEARENFMTTSADRQQAVRDTCTKYRAGSSDLTTAQTNTADPVPGVFNMKTSCDWVERF